MSNKNDKKNALIEFLSAKTSLPSDMLAGDFRLEIRGRNNAIICGCKRILKYTPQEIVLSAKGFAVGITGKRLICTSYHEGAVCIEGYVCGVEFDLDTSNGGEK